MKKYTWMYSLAALALAALACNAVMGGGGSAPAEPTAQRPAQPTQADAPTAEAPAPTEEPLPTEDYSYGGDSAVSTEFPLPDDASSVMSLGEAGVNFQTGLKPDDAMAFYRDAFGKQGLEEREILTVVSDGVFSMVFDGHPSGKAVVIQGVDLGGGLLNINIRLEDV